MPIVPIRTELDHARAVARIEALWGAEPGTAAADELDVLVTLVDAWEAQQQPIAAPDPVEAIRFRMDQMGLQRRDLAPILGGRSRVSEVLAGKRPLSLAMIRRLRAALGISADALVGP
ncbi:MAG: helix-turn-helix domain-containing protein [Deltaproteobacteria bacterium]|nr:helix-turn-helix domain-containing protein [Deltaproteobacteria bacterium]